MSYKISIPTFEEIEDTNLGGYVDITHSDFCDRLLANNVKIGKYKIPETHRIWTCETTNPGKSKTPKLPMAATCLKVFCPFKNKERDNFSRPDEMTVGVLPIIYDASDAGISIAMHAGKKVLSKNGRVCVYPQSRAPENIEKDLLRYLDSSGLVGASAISIIEQDRSLFGGTKHNAVKCKSYRYNGEIYTRLNDEFFRHEPIEVVDAGNDRIIFKKVITACPFDEYSKFKETCRSSDAIADDEIDTDNYFIGAFLHNVLLHEISIASLELKLTPDTITKNLVPPQDETLKKIYKFNIGDNVKIKCEGKQGIVKAVTSDIATLNVDNKILKYRLEDLEIIG